MKTKKKSTRTPLTIRFGDDGQWRAKRSILALSAGVVFLCLLSSCAFQSYKASPINPTDTVTRFSERSPYDPAFQRFLTEAGYPDSKISADSWDEDRLVLAALYFNPQLDVARAQWKAATASQITARQRPLPGVSVDTENHKQTDNGASPWTYGLTIDLPIETGGKRQARIDRAINLSEAARIDIAQSAWQVRYQVSTSLAAYRYALSTLDIRREEVSLREAIVAMLEKRFSAGMVSSIELSNARILLQKSRQQLIADEGRVPIAYATLAANTGLPVEALSKLSIPSPIIWPHKAQLITDTQKSNFQDAAMLNRLDIRASLSRYAAAEAKLRLEIARQYPDISLSPGYSYDQGDKIWSLGISSLLTMIHGNKGLIAEATALRELEAAQFEALQAAVIADFNKSIATYQASSVELEKAQQLIEETQHRNERIDRQFRNGIVDRLELTTTKLEGLLAEQNRIDAAYRYRAAYMSLENTIQQPLDAETNSLINSDTTEQFTRERTSTECAGVCP